MVNIDLGYTCKYENKRIFIMDSIHKEPFQVKELGYPSLSASYAPRVNVAEIFKLLDVFLGKSLESSVIT